MTRIRTMGGFEYRAPGSLAEALGMLGNATRVLAGGTDLVLQMRQGQVSPSLVVDVKGIPELNRLEWTAKDGLCVGAAVSLSRLLVFPAVREMYGMLAQACAVIGSTQIRNRGTLGGNVCNAAPSADSAPSLLCLGARAILASRSGSRTVDLDDFFLGPGQTAVRDDELLVEIRVPTPPPGSAGAYLRHTTREEMDIAVVGVAAWLERSEAETVAKARIALGSVGPTPLRARQAEDFLTGKRATPEVVEEAATKAAAAASPISDLRGSLEYRREMVKVLTRRALLRACTDPGFSG